MSVSIIRDVRFRTGEPCVESGLYRFDGYTDTAPLPASSGLGLDRSIRRGDLFPAIGPDGRPCFWVLDPRPPAGLVEPGSSAGDDALRAAAGRVRDDYEPGGMMAEWTVLDAEDIVDHADQG